MTTTSTCSTRRSAGRWPSAASPTTAACTLNSAIWNNALWTIRTQLAKIDGKPANESQLAHDFDLIVYSTLTTSSARTPRCSTPRTP